jgi:hypothetical protein
VRLTFLLAIIIGMIGYGYGVYSHAFRTFPIELAGAVKRLVAPDRGSPVPLGEAIKDTSRRQEVDCGRIGGDAAILLIMGQSNAANSGEWDSRYASIHDVINFNWLDGKCYRAEDPLLGTDGDGGSIWTRLGDELIENAGYRQVVLVDVAVSGTYIRAWAGENGPARRAVDAARKLRRHGLRFTHVLWQQGESDWETQPAVYIRLFKEMATYLRSNGVEAPIFVAQSTYCMGRRAPGIQRAQYDLPGLVENVYPGANTDLVDRFRDRQDDFCHFRASGLAQVARLWRQAITAHEPITAAIPDAQPAPSRP